MTRVVISRVFVPVVFDASGKPGSNLLSLTKTGMWQWLGDYDECQEIGDKTAHYCLFQGANGTILPELIHKVGARLHCSLEIPDFRNLEAL